MILGFLKGFNVDGKRKPTDFENKIKKGIKLHTIRIDEKCRWNKGNKIHFATGVRTSKYNCFKEGLCDGVQEIEIHSDRNIFIDGVSLILDCDIEWLSDNDGFNCVDDFWAWFDQYTPFKGKIIHWTELRY